ncbi:hypothetical protein GCM10022255_010580 [Dactylosporangium darangshiense]|uniref:CoA-binding domain-containing protein n=1 Tax=Dactylosporangium darangshiense TaxID=579108 RepID=A0ABP8CYQ0_9ACTN
MRTARQILADARTVAVVGASRDPLEPAHWVPGMLQEQSWRIIPVNPHAVALFGEHVYARLADIPCHVDVVDVFRPAAEAAEIVREAAAIGAGAVWLQPGIVSTEARRLAQEAGLDYVEDTCIGTERALSQMVVGGDTPPSPVYRGVVPCIEPEPGPVVPAHSAPYGSGRRDRRACRHRRDRVRRVRASSAVAAGVAAEWAAG